MSSCHGENPLVFDLLAHVQIQLCQQESVTSSTQRRSSASIRGSNIGTSIEMTKIFMSFLAISTCKFIREDLSSNPIDSNCEVMICNSCISSLYAPKRFRKTINSGRRVEDNFCSIETKSHPVKRMMPAITDVDTYFAKISDKNRMT